MHTEKLWNKNFTLVVVGQFISLFANNILHFALSLYILDLTGSGVAFGTITGLSLIPMAIFMPVGGMLVDRLDRKKLMVAMDAITGLSICIAYVPLFGKPSLLTVTILLMVLSVVEAFYIPCVQACIPSLQGEGNLIRANGIITQISIGANIIGPVIGGVLYGVFGAKLLVLVGMVFFFGAAILELFIHMPFQKPEKTGKTVFQVFFADIGQCVEFLWRKQRGMLKVLLVVAMFNLLVTPLVTVGLPYIVRILLGMSGKRYGFATGCVFAAAFLGGMLTTMWGEKLKSSYMYRALLLIGCSILPIGIGFAMGLQGNIIFTIVVVSLMVEQLFVNVVSIFFMTFMQKTTPNHLLGKVMAFSMTLSICTEPIGRAMFGTVFEIFADRIHWVIFPIVALVCVLALLTKKPMESMELSEHSE